MKRFFSATVVFTYRQGLFIITPYCYNLNWCKNIISTKFYFYARHFVLKFAKIGIRGLLEEFLKILHLVSIVFDENINVYKFQLTVLRCLQESTRWISCNTFVALEPSQIKMFTINCNQCQRNLKLCLEPLFNSVSNPKRKVSKSYQDVVLTHR